MTHRLKATDNKHMQPKYDSLLSNFVYKFSLHRYTTIILTIIALQSVVAQ
jgi:hypothetical protein